MFVVPNLLAWWGATDMFSSAPSGAQEIFSCSSCAPSGLARLQRTIFLGLKPQARRLRRSAAEEGHGFATEHLLAIAICRIAAGDFGTTDTPSGSRQSFLHRGQPGGVGRRVHFCVSSSITTNAFKNPSGRSDVRSRAVANLSNGKMCEYNGDASSRPAATSRIAN